MREIYSENINNSWTYFSTSNFGGAWIAILCINFSDTRDSPTPALAASANGLPYFNANISAATAMKYENELRMKREIQP